jgi:hypothetical protein
LVLALNHPDLSFDRKIDQLVSDIFSSIPASSFWKAWKARKVYISTNFCTHNEAK